MPVTTDMWAPGEVTNMSVETVWPYMSVGKGWTHMSVESGMPVKLGVRSASGRFASRESLHSKQAGGPRRRRRAAPGSLEIRAAGGKVRLSPSVISDR